MMVKIACIKCGTEAGFRVLPPLLQSSSRSKRGLFSRNVCLLVTKD